MSVSTLTRLTDLEMRPYLTDAGDIADELAGKVGLYAIYDAEQVLQYVGYSRDVAAGLKLHLVRQPAQCHWVKVQTVQRPSRTVLEEMRSAWIAEHGAMPAGNAADQAAWEKPIDAKVQMTAEERSAIAAATDLDKIKLLKNLARRVQADILETLKARGATLDLRFNPKLKEQGLLDLK
ncbi:MAG: GIY-YIG nuclease family protein [Cyanobacteria bacterium J06632_22]